jgi:hypothetical protein
MPEINSGLDEAYRSLADDQTYRPATFERALEHLRQSISPHLPEAYFTVH